MTCWPIMDRGRPIIDRVGVRLHSVITRYDHMRALANMRCGAFLISQRNPTTDCTWHCILTVGHIRPVECILPVGCIRPVECIRPVKCIGPVDCILPVGHIRPVVCILPVGHIRPVECIRPVKCIR